MLHFVSEMNSDPSGETLEKNNYPSPEVSLERKDLQLKIIKHEELTLERGASSSYHPEEETRKEVEETEKPKVELTVRKKFRRFRHKEYQCDECDRMFTLKHNLQNHFVQYHMGCKTLHKASPSCKCTICGKIYSAASVLAEHMLLEHQKKLKQEECSVCHETFLTATALLKHMREHKAGKKCTYSGCEGLEFKFTKELKEHVRLKHRREELTCSMCNMVFRQLSAKIKHERTHENSSETRSWVVQEHEGEDENKEKERKAKCDEDLVKREPSPLTSSSSPIRRRKFFCPEFEAVPIKRKTAKRLTKAEILAKIK